MKIITVSDIHGRVSLLRSLKYKEGDMLIVAGDLTNIGGYKALSIALHHINESPCKHKVVVLGNHDFISKENEAILKKEFPEINLLRNEVVDIEGLKIYGTPYTREFCNWANPYYDESEQMELTLPKEDVDIIICHEPPSHPNLSYVENYGEKLDIGNNLLADYLKTSNAKLVVSGHVHECYAPHPTVIGNCKCYNTSEHTLEIEIGDDE